MARTAWTKRLSVDKRIVKLLSAATYEDFPGAIREMVSNAFDADATVVNINIDLKGDVIEIIDDGIGMTPDEFEYFLRIAGQHGTGKKLKSQELGRERIGQFGIGFLSIFPFGKRIQVISSALRSDIRFDSLIPSEKFIQPSRFSENVEDIPIEGQQIQDPQFQNMHGTTIRIIGLSNLVEMYFKPRNSAFQKADNTIRAWLPLERLKWTLQEDLPIDFPDDSSLKEAFSDFGSSGMKVFLNGEELFRNAPGLIVLENSSWKFNDLYCRYVISTNWKSIVPPEDRYFKQRLKNVGIGKRTSFDLGLVGRAYSRLHWLTGEIRIIKGFDNILSIDRSRFLDSPDYDHYYKYFQGRLSHFATYVEDIAEAERDIKRQLTNSRMAEVGAKNDIIKKKIETLGSKGFSVEKKHIDESTLKSDPINVNIEQKTIEVIYNHPAFNDSISVCNQLIPIEYYEINENQEGYFIAKWIDDDTVAINTGCHLFKSRRYGDMFKKIFIVMLVVARRNNTKFELISDLLTQIEVEFKDII